MKADFNEPAYMLTTETKCLEEPEPQTNKPLGQDLPLAEQLSFNSRVYRTSRDLSHLSPEVCMSTIQTLNKLEKRCTRKDWAGVKHIKVAMDFGWLLRH